MDLTGPDGAPSPSPPGVLSPLGTSAPSPDRSAPSPKSSPPISVRVDIGEIVLHGLDRRVDADLLSAAFSAELQRLLRVQGVPLAAGGTDTELNVLAGLPPLPVTTSPDRLGVALARSVHAGLSGRGHEQSPRARAGKRR